MSSTTNQMAMSFLKITDSDTPLINEFAKSIITEDGHPMVNPLHDKWIINDTYPDIDNCRTLMLFNAAEQIRIDLGKFCFSDTHVDMSLEESFFQGIDGGVLKNINRNKTAFFRSGLHCDLHPRWLADGKTAAFDSIHEGKRQIYGITFNQI